MVYQNTLFVDRSKSWSRKGVTFAQFQKTWEWLASSLPHCLQQGCKILSCLLLMYRVIKYLIMVFQPYSLHCLEQVETCCRSQTECQSSSVTSICSSVSHLHLTYIELTLLQLCRHLYILETIFDGSFLYAPLIISTSSLPSCEKWTLISVLKKCLNWKYLNRSELFTYLFIVIYYYYYFCY